ncbi:conserved hypothetical protein [Xanthomonas phaseoli pv. phaseoli]|uniref:Uncharacterized protein n=1 Tax=Xanthomonas campestris pv. phaseoli TaxID=317013 RepID=A0AB38E1M3_XANCH|nr:conserved hypothetical protein [Xanthomonas phaseoli pv. phaseoli]SON85857.1 conserved hypothetical protein [Xanthomonas phaseoli pv. phaseoli]SON90391.1 conserved hypothetical protein [Xanthomonas phaseoli pv. phaseoli]SOO28116.1 conserved hypothetical protein [Xanthomonas phaseoli pv. phaseoli]
MFRIGMYHAYTPVPVRRPRPPDDRSLRFVSHSQDAAHDRDNRRAMDGAHPAPGDRTAGPCRITAGRHRSSTALRTALTITARHRRDVRPGRLHRAGTGCVARRQGGAAGTRRAGPKPLGPETQPPGVRRARRRWHLARAAPAQSLQSDASQLSIESLSNFVGERALSSDQRVGILTLALQQRLHALPSGSGDLAHRLHETR